MIEAHITLTGVHQVSVELAARRAFDAFRTHVREVAGTDELLYLEGPGYRIEMQDRADD
jgi:hypothetical protein